VLSRPGDRLLLRKRSQLNNARILDCPPSQPPRYTGSLVNNCRIVWPALSGPGSDHDRVLKNVLFGDVAHQPRWPAARQSRAPASYLLLGFIFLPQTKALPAALNRLISNIQHTRPHSWRRTTSQIQRFAASGQAARKPPSGPVDSGIVRPNVVVMTQQIQTVV
jgi:hypothetical protein